MLISVDEVKDVNPFYLECMRNWDAGHLGYLPVLNHKEHKYYSVDCKHPEFERTVPVLGFNDTKTFTAYSKIKKRIKLRPKINYVFDSEYD